MQSSDGIVLNLGNLHQYMRDVIIRHPLITLYIDHVTRP